ncbi:MAG TPA: hypothetical protein VIF15_06785 [Polyangiaceae bacterium]|jgi:hypothetical protein
MRSAHVQFVHASTVVSYADARTVVRALRKQARQHFAPAYGIRAEVELVPQGRQDPGAWQIVIADGAVRAAEDGWHETTQSGLPLGKVLAEKVIGETGGWSSTASHELLELLADPYMSLTVVGFEHHHARLFAYEICDAVQDDRYSYFIDGVRVSDFVTPAWFEGFHAPDSVPFDHRGHCVRPFHVLSGGYASVAHQDWVRGWRDVGPPRGKIGHALGSRRERRRKPRSEWRRSQSAPGARRPR